MHVPAVVGGAGGGRGRLLCGEAIDGKVDNVEGVKRNNGGEDVA